MPLLRILVLVCAVAFATGALDALEVACTDDCADAGGAGDTHGCADGCTPLCPGCPGARAPGAVTPTIMVAPAHEPPPRIDHLAHRERIVRSPDPREILHVPIALAS